MKKKRYKLKWKRIIVAIIILILVIVNVIQIISYFSVKRTKYEQTSESRPNTQVETKTSENAVKNENNDISRFCTLHVVTCPDEFDNETELVKQISAKYDVDWKLIEAIVRHETGNRTSRAYHELNNVGGLMGKDGLMKFDSKEESYERLVYVIKKYYIDMGLTTIEEIQKKYAPVGVENDPNNLNQYWVKGVKSIYENL
jgi:hypothetical protein